MTFFIVIGLVCIWAACSWKIACVIFEHNRSRVRFKRLALVILLLLAPFGYDLYVFYGFQIYCRSYAGVLKLNPITTDSLAINHRLIPEYSLLTHSALNYVEYIDENGKRFAKSLSADSALCMGTLHLSRKNSLDKNNRALAKEIENRGFCYSDTSRDETPRYLFTTGKPEKFEYKVSNASWFPRMIGISPSLQIVDQSNQSVLSESISIVTKPGWLVQLVLPETHNYRCRPAPKPTNSLILPHQAAAYSFLEQAILKDN